MIDHIIHHGGRDFYSISSAIVYHRPRPCWLSIHAGIRSITLYCDRPRPSTTCHPLLPPRPPRSEALPAAHLGRERSLLPPGRRLLRARHPAGPAACRPCRPARLRGTRPSGASPTTPETPSPIAACNALSLRPPRPRHTPSPCPARAWPAPSARSRALSCLRSALALTPPLLRAGARIGTIRCADRYTARRECGFGASASGTCDAYRRIRPRNSRAARSLRPAPCISASCLEPPPLAPALRVPWLCRTRHSRAVARALRVDARTHRPAE
jgi:hypothetical protein